MADIDWSNIPKEVIALDTLGQTEVLITAWSYVTLVIPLDGLIDNTELIGANAYPYITEPYTMSPFAIEEPLTLGIYIGGNANTNIIPLEYQPLPELTGITSSESIHVVLLGCDDKPVEFWG